MALGLFNVISAMQLHGRFRCVPDFLFVFTKFDFEHCSRISKFSIVTTVLPLFIRNVMDFVTLHYSVWISLCHVLYYSRPAFSLRAKDLGGDRGLYLMLISVSVLLFYMQRPCTLLAA